MLDESIAFAMPLNYCIQSNQSDLALLIFFRIKIEELR